MFCFKMYNKLKIIIVINLLLTVFFTTKALVVAADNNDPIVIIGKYHIEVNELVNQKIKSLYAIFEETEVKKMLKSGDPKVLIALSPKLMPPTDISETTCTENVSASCLTFLINAKYKIAAQNAIHTLSQIDTPADNSAITNAGNVSAARQQFILQELKNARNVSEATIEFYKQLLFAYPLHFQLQNSADNLQELQSQISKFNDILKDYPSKFHDATTTQCM